MLRSPMRLPKRFPFLSQSWILHPEPVEKGQNASKNQQTEGPLFIFPEAKETGANQECRSQAAGHARPCHPGPSSPTRRAKAAPAQGEPRLGLIWCGVDLPGDGCAEMARCHPRHRARVPTLLRTPARSHTRAFNKPENTHVPHTGMSLG